MAIFPPDFKIAFRIRKRSNSAISEIDAESMTAVEMVTMSSGVFTSVEGIEIIDSKSMTAAMETASKVVSAYQAPNK